MFISQEFEVPKLKVLIPIFFLLVTWKLLHHVNVKNDGAAPELSNLNNPQ